MNILLYILLFIIGILFGSFYTLAIYRIPNKQDITHTHSYCPKCNHKLGFLDLIPIFSYISLKGKCRYCKQKISPRYIIIEILSGLLFVLMAYVMKFTYNNLTIARIIQYGFVVLYITFIFLISGIDKERRIINKSVVIYGMVVSIMYIIYLCIVEQTSIYRYVIYGIIYIVILILNALMSKEDIKGNYVLGILSMIVTLVIFTGEYIAINSIIATLLAVAFYILLNQMEDRKINGKKSGRQFASTVSIAFYLGVANMLALAMLLLFINYIF